MIFNLLEAVVRRIMSDIHITNIILELEAKLIGMYVKYHFPSFGEGEIDTTDFPKAITQNIF